MRHLDLKRAVGMALFTWALKSISQVSLSDRAWSKYLYRSYFKLKMNAVPGDHYLTQLGSLLISSCYRSARAVVIWCSRYLCDEGVALSD
jgi:hypothetical protein